MERKKMVCMVRSMYDNFGHLMDDKNNENIHTAYSFVV